MKHLFAIACAALIGAGSAAHAAPFTYFGENLNPGAAVSGDPLTARTAFLSALSGGIGTENFEGVSGSAPIALSFPGSTGSITATLNGDADIQSGPNAGRFATSGSRYVETDSGGDFSIGFSSPISAFGFYGTDIGDFGNQLVLRLTASGGGTVDLNVGNTLGSSGSTSGSLLFFGFVDTMDAYTSIAFLNIPGSADVFGFDDMTIGDLQQIVNPPQVPLPASVLLLGSGLVGLLGFRRKSRA